MRNLDSVFILSCKGFCKQEARKGVSNAESLSRVCMGNGNL